MPTENSSEQPEEGLSLIKKLISDFICLISEHIKFFREEIKEETGTIAKSVILALIACLATILGAFFGGIFLIIILSYFMQVWFSVLAVTLLYLLISLIIFVYISSQFKKIDKKRKKLLEVTSKTLEEIKKWPEHLKY